MTRDPWNERFEEDEYLTRMRNEQFERRLEKGSVGHPPASSRAGLREANTAAIPGMRWEEPRFHEKAGMFDSWIEMVGFAVGIVFSLIVGLAVALAIFFAVAWAMSG